MVLAMTFSILRNAVCQRWKGLHNSVNQIPVHTPTRSFMGETSIQVTEYRKSADVVLGSTQRPAFKKPPSSDFWYIIKEE